MKLLLDQNLSRWLCTALKDIFPDSTHVRQLFMDEATDTAIWNFASTVGYTVVSKDSDFHQRSLLLGSPPKVIYLKVGNSSTKEVEAILRLHHNDVVAFIADPTATCLILS